MRPVLLALVLLGCAHADLRSTRATPTPLPSDSSSANLQGEHGSRAHPRPEQAMAAAIPSSQLHLRVTLPVSATLRLTHDPTADKRVLRRLRESAESPLRLPATLTDLSLEGLPR